MFAVPRFFAVTCGCVAGWVWPAGMDTEVGETAPMVESLLDSVTVTPPAGAAVERTTGNDVDWPERSTVFAGRLMEPSGRTVIFVVPLATFAVVVLAVKVVLPAATPDTGTVAVFELAGMVTDAGIPAIPAGLVPRLTTIAAGVAADSVTV